MQRRRSSESRGPRLRDGEPSPRAAAEQFLNTPPVPPTLPRRASVCEEDPVVQQLQQTIESQRYELEKREEMISALQRNAANLSNLPKPSGHDKADHARVLEQLKTISRELSEERGESARLKGLLVSASAAQQERRSSSGLEETNQALGAKVNDLQKELNDLTKVSSDRMKRLGEAKRQAAAAEAAVQGASAEAEAMKTSLATAQASEAAAKKDAEINQAEMWQQKKHASAAGLKLEELQKQLQHTQAQHMESASMLAGMQTQLRAATLQANEWKGVAEKGAQEAAGMEQLKAQLASKTAEVEGMLSKLNGCREELIQHQTRANQAEADALEAEELAAAADEAATQARGAMAAAMTAHDETKTLLATSQSENARLKAEMQQSGDVGLEVAVLNEALETLRRQEMAALEGQEALRVQLVAAQGETGVLKAQQEGALEKLRLKLASAQEELLLYKKEANEASAEALHAEEQLAEAMSKLERQRAGQHGDQQLATELEAALAEVTMLEGQAAGMEHTHNTLQTAQAALQAEVNELKAQAAQHESEVNGLQQQLTELAPSEDMQSAKKSFNDALAKLHGAQEALEGVLTCMGCMELYKDPMTLHPCGHTYCKACCERSKEGRGGEGYCEECGEEGGVESLSVNCLVDELCGKFTYQKQVVQSLEALKL